MLEIIDKLVRGTIINHRLDSDRWLRVEFSDVNGNQYERLFFYWEDSDYIIQLVPTGVEDASVNRSYTGATIKMYTSGGSLLLTERMKGSITIIKNAALIKLKQRLFKNLTMLESLINGI